MARRRGRAFSKTRLKRWLYRKARGRCHYCTTDLIYEVSTIDHKKARSKGGTYDRCNVVLACRKCNAEKADKPYKYYKALWHARLAKQRMINERIRV
jgi:5-methylcytosine-specific restriction enzyme A